MGTRLKTLRQDLSQSLAFLPTCLISVRTTAAIAKSRIEKVSPATVISEPAITESTVRAADWSPLNAHEMASWFSPWYWMSRETWLRKTMSNTTAAIARTVTTCTSADLAGQTRGRLDARYPERVGSAVGVDAGKLLPRWRREPAGRAEAVHDGFVRRVTVTELMRTAREAGAERVCILVRPRDFVATSALLAEVWPAGAAERSCAGVRQAVVLSDERDLHDDAAFGLRQLGDIALKALSPGTNDPATAVTCIGYLRSLLVLMAAREPPDAVRRVEGLTVVVARRGFDEDLDVLLQISRYVGGDAGPVDRRRRCPRCPDTPRRGAHRTCVRARLRSPPSGARTPHRLSAGLTAGGAGTLTGPTAARGCSGSRTSRRGSPGRCCRTSGRGEYAPVRRTRPRDRGGRAHQRAHPSGPVATTPKGSKPCARPCVKSVRCA